jgi:hypothetical protein
VSTVAHSLGHPRPAGRWMRASRGWRDSARPEGAHPPPRRSSRSGTESPAKGGREEDDRIEGATAARGAAFVRAAKDEKFPPTNARGVHQIDTPQRSSAGPSNGLRVSGARGPAAQRAGSARPLPRGRPGVTRRHQRLSRGISKGRVESGRPIHALVVRRVVGSNGTTGSSN